jgi:lipoprotein-anchoring transpeptidase ErfK/SrfK
VSLDRQTRMSRIAIAVISVTVMAVVAAVVIGRSDDRNGALATQSAPRRETPATVTVTPGPNAVNVDPLGAVTVSAANGALTDVQMVNDQDKPIPGAMSPDHLVWKPGVPLGYGRSYTITVVSRGPTGTPASQMSRFTTLTPKNQASVSLTTTSGAVLRDGGSYGIGTVIVAHFDEPITDRAAAQRRLIVTTAPAVEGSWYWVDDQNAHWRPEHYYAAGTKIRVAANIYGAPLGGGLYGQQDQQTSFTIGDAHVSIADDNTKQVNVYDNGVLVRTMPTSMGMGGTQTVAGHTLTFWTPPGVYTVMDKSNPVVMDSSTYGLPVSSHLGYRETINYATRISPDGIYLHQLDSTVWAQGNTDTSHGCLNLNGDNAKWFFGFSQPGDIVEIRNTGGPSLSLQNNGDWSVPWAQWQAGSALA